MRLKALTGRLALCLFVAWVGLSLTGCALIRELSFSPPLTDQQLSAVILQLKDQEAKVSSFFSQGTLLVKDWTWEAETQVLIVGLRNPFRVKVEITHGWGQPILHMLVDRNRLEVLSFQEYKLYVGAFTPKALSRFLPGELDTDLIWAALRGYPGISPLTKTLSPGRNRISFVDEKGEEIETMDLQPEDLQPVRVTYPKQHLHMEFADMKEIDGILFAGTVSVDSGMGGRKLSLLKDRMVFNKPIPPEIFTIEKPPNFTVVSLD
ncbi:MAG: hypothetical protein AB1512_31270 [Thermodesulfobacteriota bacterium]